MYKPLTFILFTLILFSACSKETVVEGEVKNPVISDIENISDDEIKFKISKSKADSSTTEQTVKVSIGKKDFEVSTIRTWDRVEQSSYELYQIPANATDAIKETNTDISKILYVYKQTTDRVVVREGLLSSNQDSIFYKAVLSLNSMDISPDPEIDYVDIIGIYGYTDQIKSQILILSINSKNMLSAVMYSSDDPNLPIKENMASMLMNAKPTALKNFFLNELKRSFKSESYYGKYRKKDDQIIFIFDNLLDRDGKAVEFKKII